MQQRCIFLITANKNPEVIENPMLFTVFEEPKNLQEEEIVLSIGCQQEKNKCIFEY